MAVTESLSTQCTAHDAGTMVPSYNGKGELMILPFQATTIAGDANSTIAICDLPAGTFQFISVLSKVYFSAFGTGRTMDIGWDAYTEEDGDTAVADEDGLNAAIDVSSAGNAVPGAALTGVPTGVKTFSSLEGVRFRCKIEAAAVGAGETVDGFLAFLK